MKYIFLGILILLLSPKSIIAQPRINTTVIKSYKSGKSLKRIPYWSISNNIWKNNTITKYSNPKIFLVNSIRSDFYVISFNWKESETVETGNYIKKDETFKKETKTYFYRFYSACALDHTQYDALKNIQQGESITIESPTVILDISLNNEIDLLERIYNLTTSRSKPEFFIRVIRTTDGKKDVIRYDNNKFSDFKFGYWEIPYNNYKKLFSIK